MKNRLSLFVFIDAFGWEVYRRNAFFLQELKQDAKRLDTIFGYSSACDPSIITGTTPSEHRMWSSFYYAPGTCPYRWLRFLSFLPDAVFSRGRVRYWLSNLIKRIHGFTGYFMLYSVPFRLLPLFEYAEKRSIWKEGVVRGTTIFQRLAKAGIPYYVHDSGTSDDARLAKLRGRIGREEIDFAYLSLGKLDALMHRVGNEGPEVTELVRWYDARVRELLAAAQGRYREVAWYVFTDHGMHNTTGSHDLIADIEALGLKYGRDYVAFYDATMARFWFPDDGARRTIRGVLERHPKGRIVPDDELRAMGVFFEDRQYGELVFLMNSAIQIVPSFMGAKGVKGLHGFHPADADSSASLISNRPLPADVTAIHHIHRLMLRETGLG